MPRLRLLPAALALLGLCATAAARPYAEIKAGGVLKIATEGAYPPFNNFDKATGQVSGFEVDLGNAVARRLGLRVEWSHYAFDTLLPNLGADKYDLVIASHTITLERQRIALFTNPHYCTGGAIVSLKGGPRRLADLGGKVIAAQAGTTYLDFVRRLPNIAVVQTYLKDTDAFSAMQAGRADVWVSDRFTGLDALKTAKKPGQSGELLFSERIGMAAARTNADLIGAVNGALAGLLQDGTYAKLSQRYFQQDVRCKQ